MSRDEDLFELDYDECEATTEDAVLLVLPEEELWVPRSVLWAEQHPEPGCGPGAIYIEGWWATKKGLA